MKVGYVAPMSISAVHGGVRTQAVRTQQHCQKMGVQSVLLSPWDDIKELDLDLVHVFGASPENSGIIPRIKELGIPVVLSPVFYSNRKISTLRRSIRLEKLTSFIGSGIQSDFSLKANLCNLSDLNLPNTTEEAKMIQYGFDIPGNKIHVIPNAVEERFSNASAELFVQTYGIRDFILFVGQASAPRKNLIQLLRLAGKIKESIVVIGSLGQGDYASKCSELIQKSDNVTQIDTLDHDSELLESAYAAARTFVLPSMYETPGIAAMEAALADCSVAITANGGTKEYFGSHAAYCDPDSLKSIMEAILKAHEIGPSPSLKSHILNNYTWDITARKTVDQYKKLIA